MSTYLHTNNPCPSVVIGFIEPDLMLWRYWRSGLLLPLPLAPAAGGTGGSPSVSRSGRSAVFRPKQAWSVVTVEYPGIPVRVAQCASTWQPLRVTCCCKAARGATLFSELPGVNQHRVAASAASNLISSLTTHSLQSHICI